MLRNGLYEEVISKEIESELNAMDPKETYIEKGKIDTAFLPRILSKYMADVIRSSLEKYSDKESEQIQKSIDLTNRLIELMSNETNDSDIENKKIPQNAEQLLALYNRKNTMFAVQDAKVQRPETPISFSSLLTGKKDPQLYDELLKELYTCDRFDMLVSFIKWSGIQMIKDGLINLVNRGGNIRVITTSYMGATEVKAIDWLSKLQNTEIKIDYDTKNTRLHAKSYILHRDSGFTTAYVGSSNISRAAMSSGLEWNIKISNQDLNDTIKKMEVTFEEYWNDRKFVPYNSSQKDTLAEALKKERYFEHNDTNLYLLDIVPYSHQTEILEKLEAERTIRNHYRNLIVAATGTGKTVISAFDYKEFKKKEGGPCRLLYIAHREEILKQSLSTYRAVLKDENFGELYDGTHKPKQIDYIFISIDSFRSQKFYEKTSNDFYDFIVVDECHHSRAESYQHIFDYKPKIMLGLTATPERMDGKSILPYFDNRIAAEIRLPEAIEQKHLCPFHYYGVSDTVDLDSIKWTRGGYDKSELQNVYVINRKIADKRANNIVNSVYEHCSDIEEVKGLGFCVSKEHAKYMAEFFNDHNIPSVAIVSDDDIDSVKRNSVKQQLQKGTIKFIFAVDIYNEGVDIPEINMVLFLRPTESLTIFLQQLGRGLRHADGKDFLTVLDFIGQANKYYRFDNKFAALLTNNNVGIRKQIENGFSLLPRGCHIRLEKKASEYILANIQSSVTSKQGLISRIKTFNGDTGIELNLVNFCNYYKIHPKVIYGKKESFSSLCVQAGVEEREPDINIQNNAKILFHFCMADSNKWITFLLQNFMGIQKRKWEDYNPEEKLMWQMAYRSIYDKKFSTEGFNNPLEAIQIFKETNKIAFLELCHLLNWCMDNIAIQGKKFGCNYACPLEVYSTYTRDQVMAALGFDEDYDISEGVKYLNAIDTDVFFTTLNKTDKYYSSTTSYNDYSINDHMFHWQSQNSTSENTGVGRRYCDSRRQMSQTLLFIREYKMDAFGAQPFVFLGPIKYKSHTGNKPMSIVWELENTIPGKYLDITKAI